MRLLRMHGVRSPRSIRKRKLDPRRCNICKDEFKPRTVFDRFCHTCKEESELLKFSSCFPEVDETILERVPA